MSNYSFKSLGGNKYEMLYKGGSFGITFITPDEYTMELIFFSQRNKDLLISSTLSLKVKTLLKISAP